MWKERSNVARRVTIQAEAPGQDSFLDVVANLVGIMIILIIVVGVVTKKAMVAAGTSRAISASIAAPVAEPVDLEALRQTASGLAADIQRSEENLAHDQFEIRYRQTEREKLLTRLSLAEKVIDEQREQLDADQQMRFDATSQLDAASSELNRLLREQEAVSQQKSSPGILEHLPTPMAKTVFGKEYHFRLKGGRVVQVPWEQLLDKLKADAPAKVERLKDSPTITETIGPIQGFWMRYTLRVTVDTVTTRGGTARQTRAGLDHFLLIPVSEDIGEPLAEALGPQSDFMTAIRGLHPERTTITIWVYPDSFSEYRTLKQNLFSRGLLTAARPMPEGNPIGASPDGSRSSAQ